MVISGNYDSNNQIMNSTNSLVNFNLDFLTFVRPFNGNILKMIDDLSFSTYTMRTLIPDETGVNRILIGKKVNV